MDMNKFRKYVNLKTIGALVAIIVGVLTIWQILRPEYQLEVDIIQTETRLDPYLIDRIKKISEFDIKKIRKREDIPEIETVTDEILDKSKPVFEHVIKNKIDFATDPLFMNTYLSVSTIRNNSNNTINDVQLYFGRRYITGSTVIEKSDGEVERDIDIKNAVKIGMMLPKSEVIIYFYSRTPVFIDNVKLINRDGTGSVKQYVPVAKYFYILLLDL